MAVIDKIKQYLAGSYNVLLALLVILFVFRPFNHANYYPGIWKAVLMISLFLVIVKGPFHRSVKITCGILIIPTLIFGWFATFYHTKLIAFGLALFSTLFLGLCALTIIKNVLLTARASIATLRGVICAYFLVAFLFCYIYMVIEFFFPGSFMINSQSAALISDVRLFSEMLYFSFITLLTIGYGDIVAVREIGQTAAITEGIIGQFYIAVLVARIVAMYSTYSDKNE